MGGDGHSRVSASASGQARGQSDSASHECISMQVVIILFRGKECNLTQFVSKYTFCQVLLLCNLVTSADIDSM